MALRKTAGRQCSRWRSARIGNPAGHLILTVFVNEARAIKRVHGNPVHPPAEVGAIENLELDHAFDEIGSL
jgi:hypothetical protein